MFLGTLKFLKLGHKVIPLRSFAELQPYEFGGKPANLQW